MEYVIHALECAPQALGFIDVETQYPNPIAAAIDPAGEILFRPRAEIVDDYNLMPLASQIFRQVRPDEPGAACHCRFCHISDSSV
jgi:hypothetical protein